MLAPLPAAAAARAAARLGIAPEVAAGRLLGSAAGGGRVCVAPEAILAFEPGELRITSAGVEVGREEAGR